MSLWKDLNIQKVWLTCRAYKCVSGWEEWEGWSVAVNLREDLHEVCAGRPGRVMGPAAVRHRVQPGQLHALPQVALYDHRPTGPPSTGQAGPGQSLRRPLLLQWCAPALHLTRDVYKESPKANGYSTCPKAITETQSKWEINLFFSAFKSPATMLKHVFPMFLNIVRHPSVPRWEQTIQGCQQTLCKTEYNAMMTMYICDKPLQCSFVSPTSVNSGSTTVYSGVAVIILYSSSTWCFISSPLPSSHAVLPEYTVLNASNTITLLHLPPICPTTTSSRSQGLKKHCDTQPHLSAPLWLMDTNMFLYNKGKRGREWRARWTNHRMSTRCTGFL